MLLGRRDRFYEPFGHWRTWIDFDKFADAAERGDMLDVVDFAAETPVWALHQATPYQYDGKMLRCIWKATDRKRHNSTRV